MFCKLKPHDLKNFHLANFLNERQQPKMLLVLDVYLQNRQAVSGKSMDARDDIDGIFPDIIEADEIYQLLLNFRAKKAGRSNLVIQTNQIKNSSLVLKKQKSLTIMSIKPNKSTEINRIKSSDNLPLFANDKRFQTPIRQIREESSSISSMSASSGLVSLGSSR